MSSPTLVIRTQLDLTAASQMDTLKGKVVSSTSEMASGFDKLAASAKNAAESEAVFAVSTESAVGAISQITPAVQEAEGGVEKLNFSMHEAKGTMALVGEELGVKIPRHIRGFIAELPGVGAAMSAAFSAFAVAGLVEVLIHGAEKLTEWISDTFIFTEAEKKAVEAIKEENKVLIELAAKTKEATRERQLLAAVGNEQKIALRTKFALEDIGGDPAKLKEELDKKIKEKKQAVEASQETEEVPAAVDIGTGEQIEGGTQSTEAAKQAQESVGRLSGEIEILKAKLTEATAEQAKFNQELTNTQKESAKASGAANLENRKKEGLAEIKLVEDQAIAKAQAIASGEKLAILASQSEQTKDLDQKSIYNAEAFRLAVQSAESIRDAKLKAANDTLAQEVSYEKGVIALHNSGSDEDKRAVVNAQSQIRVLTINHTAELLKINDDYDSKIVAARTKAAQDEIKIASEQAAADAKAVQESARLKEQQLKGQESIIDGQVKEVESGAARELDTLKEKAKTHQITLQQELDAEHDVNDKEYAAAAELLRKKEALFIEEAQVRAAAEGKTLSVEQAKELEGFQKLQNQKDAIYSQYLKKQQDLTNQSLTQQQASFQKYFTTFQSGFNSAINSWLQGQATMKQAAEKLFGDVLKGLTGFVEQWIEKRAEMWLEDEILSKTTQAASGISQVTSAAGVAAANAFAATAAIPIVGPELAPAAAATALSEVLAFTSLAAGSAQGGALLPSDMFLLAHQNEMVLPSHLSSAVQDMAAEGGHGSGHTININAPVNASAIDGTGMRQILTQHVSVLGEAVTNAVKSGAISKSSLGVR